MKGKKTNTETIGNHGILNKKKYNIIAWTYLIFILALLIYQCLSSYYLYNIFLIQGHATIDNIKFYAEYFPISVKLLFKALTINSYILQDLMGYPYIATILVFITPVLLFVLNKKQPVIYWFKIKKSKSKLCIDVCACLIIASIVSIILDDNPPSIAEQLHTSYFDFITWFFPLVFSPLLEEFTFRITLIGCALLIANNLNMPKASKIVFISIIIFLSAFLDMSLHLQYSYLSLINVFILFICSGYLFFRSRNILVPILFHSFINLIAIITGVLMIAV